MSSDLFGTFSEPGNLSSGDPYKKTVDDKGRFGGKQFSTVSSKTGKAPDSYIDKEVRSLALGDRYVDAWILEKRLKKSGKALSEKPFYSHVATHAGISYGPGTNDGCISKDMPFDSDGSAAAARSNPPRRPADKLRNMYTAGPKKGGFGMPWKDMSLGEPPKYYCDVYDGGREKEKELRLQSKPISAKPFLSAAASRRSFTPDPQLYQTPAPAGAAGSSSSPGTRSSSRPSSAPGERPQSAPWRPSSPPKQGAAYSVISQVGRNYVPDPAREAKYHGKGNDSTKPFRPTSGPKARLSMWSVNPYTTVPRPAPDIDFTIT